MEEGMLSKAEVIPCPPPLTLKASSRRAASARMHPTVEPIFPFETGEERPLDRLVALQRADGSWDLTPELAEILAKSLDELEEPLRDAIGDPSEARRAWATALALSYLEKEAPQWREEWEMLAEKAIRWLGRCQARLTDWDTWLSVAGSVLSSS